MEFKYGKEEANLIKGIAIIAMFYHHFFGFPSWRSPETSFFAIPVGNVSLQYMIASFFKICVGLYAFTSGYSLFYSKNKKYDLGLITKRAFSFLTRYWIVFAIYLGFAVLFKEPFSPFRRFVQQWFGVSTATGFSWKYFDGIHPVFCWYVSFYLLFLFLAPVLAKLCRFGFWMDNGILLIVLFGTHRVLTSVEIINGSVALTKLVTAFATWGHVGMIGYLFAKYGIFQLIHEWLTTHLKHGVIVIISILVLPIMVILWNYLGTHIAYEISYISIYTPIFIYAVLYIIKTFRCTWMELILTVLSKESTNMWFLHGLFFTPNKTIQWIAYLPKYPILIMVWVVVIMYICSKIITLVTEYIKKFVKGLRTKVICP